MILKVLISSIILCGLTFSYDDEEGWMQIENPSNIDNSFTSIESPVNNIVCAEFDIYKPIRSNSLRKKNNRL